MLVPPPLTSPESIIAPAHFLDIKMSAFLSINKNNIIKLVKVALVGQIFKLVLFASGRRLAFWLLEFP